MPKSIDLHERVKHLKDRDESPAPNDCLHDQRLDKLLRHIVEEISLYGRHQIQLVKRLSKIGIALSAEKNLNKLLELIVDEARSFTRADAGTLYLLDEKEELLTFEIIQNDTLKIRMGGTSGNPVSLPSIPLRLHDGRPNYCNVSSYSALTAKIVNIADVYEAAEFDFTGPRKYDSATGYRSKSMLVIPMMNHQNSIIGVLQLLNALDSETGEVVPFLDEYVDLAGCLASQAAVALDNAQLIQSLKDLFDAFIKSIATAIDQKSPYTGGHVRRVVELTTMIALRINETTEGVFADVHLSDDQIEELRLAAWMHDVGKIITPEYVINKRTKLETLFDRIHLVETRFDLIESTIETGCLKRKIELLERGENVRDGLRRLDEELKAELQRVRDDRELVRLCNTSLELVQDERVERLRGIARKTYSVDGREYPYLTPDELYNLTIRKGNLTLEERRTIEEHALMTMEILKDVPFPKELSHLLEFAVKHHEKLDGSGYPFGIPGDDIPLQARILAIADIFEALTAKDRPYKSPMKLSEAIRILSFMKKDHHIDGDIFDLFLASGLHQEYARRELIPEQRDDVV
jgi:HD-GYP domain-containing protein (c-di-GMP phosphodiesterase class II)